MTDLTYDQLSTIHEAMCLAWSMAPSTSPEWPMVWNDVTPPPWKPLWRDFIDTLDLDVLGAIQGPYENWDGTYQDTLTHLHASLRLGTASWQDILNRPLLWEHIWMVKQYLNELPDPRDEGAVPVPTESYQRPVDTESYQDSEEMSEWERLRATCHKALNLLDSVMDSEDRVLSENTYVELCNALKELHNSS
jgi:hypothetical protein